MQINFTLKKAWQSLNKTMSAFLLLCFMGGTINAQTYVNSNLSTGATATGGGAAPAGYTWSELQPGSTSFGAGASITNNIRLGDDFTVPAGNTWNLTSMTFFGYQTGFTGTTSPFTTIRVTIHSGSIIGPVVFGDQTTNRFASSSDALMYRIANATPGTTRRIWSINATTVVTLPAGTYWIEFATNVTGGVAHFLPLGTVVGTTTQPGNNAQQNTGTAWAPLLDGTNPQDMPFRINYTSGPVTPCLGTPAPGNTITSNAAVCPGTGFTLSLQNATTGAGVTYQWQSSLTLAGPYAPVVPSQTNATYSVASITATTFYRAVVTCGGNSGTSTPVQVTANPPSACYCASTATNTDDEEILNVTVGTLNNSSTCATTAPGSNSVRNLYSNYTGYTGAPTGNIFRGLSNSLSIQLGSCGGAFANGTAMFIDYNQDGDFIDAGERVYGLGATINGPHIETASFTVPVTATPGVTRMRVINVFASAGTAINPCGTYTYGETEDYNINIVVPPACTGTPAPGNTLSTSNSVCSGTTPFTLSLQNNPAVSGLTYQWFSSPTATGTFTPITGANAATYTVASLASATCYYAAVTCSGVTTNSSTLCIAINPVTQCYCVPGPSSCAADDVITNVTITDLNNNSTCSTGPPAGYSNFTALSPGTLIQGAANSISVTATNGGTEYAAVWIDFNQNGVFNTNEFTAIGSGPGGTFTNNIVVPANALLGSTRMRVRLRFGTPLTAASACIGYGFGETEDYTVNIVPCVPVSITSSPASVSAVCGSSAVFTAGVTGSIPAFQWTYRINATSPWLNVPNAAPYSGVNSATLRINPVATGMNGYQYRAVVTGACTAADFTATATLTVTQLAIAVTPAAITKCLAAAPVLLTVPANSQTVTVTSNYGPGGFLVPDGPAGPGPIPGVNTSLAVSGIPVGANILSIAVKINMTQTYVGDMIVNLKSPTSTATTGIINLFALLDNGTGANSTDNFVNTTIASNGVTALSGAPAPRTGIFRADAYITTSPPLTAALPSNGGAANVNNWSSLLSTPNANGNWTLFLADAGAGDTAVLADWSISITYGGAPSSAIFTPNAGLFTDAAGTIPYTGNAVTQVYAAPTSTTTYSAVVSSGACSTAPQSIVVTVNTPVGASTASPLTLANSTICTGSNTSFALGGTLTGGPGFTHQFQVSTNGGATYTNISNGGVYSGATTSTLTLTNVPATFNGYRFRDSINTVGGCGSLISPVAILTVNPTPVVTISAAPVRNLFPGLTTTLTAAVSPNPTGALYQWFRNGTAVAGGTNNRLLVNIDGVGTYTIRVTDANGCIAAAGTSTPGSIVIGDSANLSRLFIYPSPNNGRFQVRYFNDVANGGLNPGVINVYDAKGSRVFSRNYNIGGGFQAMNVDLGASHGSGIYRVDLLTSTGERNKTGTVIIF